MHTSSRSLFSQFILFSSAIASITLLSTNTFANNLQGKIINYSVNGEVYEGYYISPKIVSDSTSNQAQSSQTQLHQTSAPLILMVHDWDGLTDYEIKRAHMLAEQGYAVFAADLFGKGIRPTEVKDKRQHTGELYKDRKKMRDLLSGALDTAKTQGGNINNAIAMGYCFGGAAVLEMARAGTNMKGFVSFHGGLTTPKGQDYKKAQGKLLILHGSADTAITLDDFAGLAKELESTGVSNEMITYSGAPHAFTVIGSPRYHEEADKKSWARFTGFLKEVL